MFGWSKFPVNGGYQPHHRNQDLLKFVKILAARLVFGWYRGCWIVSLKMGVWTWRNPQVQRLSRILSVVFFVRSIRDICL